MTTSTTDKVLPPLATRILKKAPLCFQGQKNKWFAQFSEFLDKIEQKASTLNRPVCAIDVFGGSGLLSHWTKRLHPSFTVIYNDFDNYSERIEHIHDVNLLMDELHKQFPERAKTQSNDKLTPPEVVRLRQFITNYKGRIDEHCLSCWIQFSGTTARTVEELLKTPNYYMHVPSNNYNEEDAKHYLDDIIVIHEDASDYNKFQQIIKPLIPPNALALYILDPPYLYCDKSGYKTSYFKLESTIDLINYFINEDFFIFFNSTKSGFTEFLHKLKEVIPTIREDYERIDKATKTNHSATNSEYALIRIT